MDSLTRAVRRDLDAAGLELGPAEEERVEQDAATSAFLHEGGWHIADSNSGDHRGGITAHRGVLDDGEYVDPFLLRELVCAELGFTYEQLRSVYKRGGPRTAEQRELRTQIDAALLALSRSGANMTQLAISLGFEGPDAINCGNVINSALTRARKEHVA